MNTGTANRVPVQHGPKQADGFADPTHIRTVKDKGWAISKCPKNEHNSLNPWPYIKRKRDIMMNI